MTPTKSLSEHTAKIALVLFSRCLENGKWPDRVEFTKYLYLLDWAHYRFKGSTASDIHWKFYHYGPWSEDVIPAMERVQDVFKLGWVDYSPEDRDIPWFDPVSEKLDLTTESLIARIISSFSKRDVSVLIDFCYRLTEPMQKSKRGEELDFKSITVTGSTPVFVSPAKSLPMPQLTAVQAAAREQVKKRTLTLGAKYEKWKKLMDEAEYKQAMAQLAAERETRVSDVPGGTNVQLTDGAVEYLDNLRHE